MKIRSFTEKQIQWIFALLLVTFAVFLCLKNYTPNTFLTGWDTLHPEFNFKIYWERIINGAWQDHQGLGTAATQAHSSEIPRVLILQFFDLFFNMSLLRYLYAFLMLILGPLGFYFLLLYLLKDKEGVSKYPAAFSGGLFYLLNLSTLQHFYVPLEMFLVHFASLGWIFLFILRYLDKKKNSALHLFLISFFFSPQAHTSTLFFSFLVVLSVFLFLFFVKDLKTNFVLSAKKFIGVLGLILLANSFWIGPNVYFILNKADDVANSKIHRLFSEEAFLQNHEYGSIKNTALLKGFLFNWGEHISNGEYGDLLDEWIIHLSFNNAAYVGYCLFFFSVLGIFIAFTKKNPYALSFLGMFLISFFFITNTNFPTGAVFELFREHVPLFKEAFRFPFTKFSSMVAFSLSIFLTFFIYYFLELIKGRYALSFFFVFTLTILNVYFMLPAFRGNLISRSMRVSIPQRYFELFEYLNEKEEYGRVANFPIHSFWGWAYYNWDQNKIGYQGAGFLWFGIKQPLLDREFDRWGSTNEDYYRQMSYAIYSQQPKLFESVLTKYQIKWLLFDKSVFQPGANDKILFYPEIEKMFSKSSIVKLEKDFGGGLYLYNVDNTYSHQEVRNKVVQVGKEIHTEEIDPIYITYGDYTNSTSANWPFVGITERLENLKEGVVTSDPANITIKLSDNFSSATKYGKLYLEKAATGLRVSLYEKGDQILSQQDFATDGPFVLEIRGTYIAIDSQSLEDRFYLGDYEISTSKSLPINIYEEIQKSDKPFTSLSVLESCSLVGSQTAYELETNRSGFNLSARNVRACVTAPLTSIYDFTLIAEPKLIVVSADIEEKLAYADICLLNSRTGVCEGSYEHGTQTMRVYKTIDPIERGDYYLRFFADSKGDINTSVGYSNIVTTVFDLVSSLELKLDPNTVYADYEKDITFPKTLSFDPLRLKLFSNPQLCSTGERDLVNSNVIYTDQSVVYTSKDKFLCDSFSLPSESSKDGYILEIISKNISGLPLRLCLTNEVSTRCDLYISLPSGNEIKTSYYLLPPTGEGRHTLNVTSINFQSQSVAENALYGISLTKIPYTYLKELHTVGIYPNSSILTLGESFDLGWKAFCGFTFCGFEHVVVNNWQNGWVLGQAQNSASIRLIYIPQVVQYFGYIMFSSTFFILIMTGNRRRKT